MLYAKENLKNKTNFSNMNYKENFRGLGYLSDFEERRRDASPSCRRWKDSCRNQFCSPFSLLLLFFELLGFQPFSVMLANESTRISYTYPHPSPVLIALLNQEFRTSPFYVGLDFRTPCSLCFLSRVSCFSFFFFLLFLFGHTVTYTNILSHAQLQQVCHYSWLSSKAQLFPIPL